MEWSYRQKQYQYFLGTPASMRSEKCQTEEDFCALFNVDRETLLSWKCLPGWWKAVSDFTMAIVGEQLPDVLMSLVDQAKKGRIQAIKLTLEYAGLLTSKSEQTVKFEDDRLIIEHRVSRPDQLPPPEHPKQEELDYIDGETIALISATTEPTEPAED